MDSHEIEMAELCLQMAESAVGHDRRILLNLAHKWLAKVPNNREAKRLMGLVGALKHPH